MEQAKRVAVLGAGSWGSALALLLSGKGLETRLWARRAEFAEKLERERSNTRYLPGIAFPETLQVTDSLAEALIEVDLVVLALPSQSLRAFAAALPKLLPSEVPLVNTAKGIEASTLMLPSQVLASELGPSYESRLTTIGGPSFAREVAEGVPSAVCVAGRDRETTLFVQESMRTERFRVYSTGDVAGVELGGALKNVIAIAVGISDGLGFGNNTRAALITRGLAEIARLAEPMGAHPMTLAGLSGMGDLVLTCTGDLSRNRHVGLELGRGRPLDDILASMTMVAEGVRTAESAHRLAESMQVEMPIVTEVYRVLYEGKTPGEAVISLMNRPPRPEWVGRA